MNLWPWRRARRGNDVHREFQSHLDLEAEQQREAGLPPADACYAARRAFGNPTLIAEQARQRCLLETLDQFFRDLKYAARSLRKTPGFTLVAVFTLALGIGANTAIFSVVSGLMLRPLPFREANQLVRLYCTENGVPLGGYGYRGGPSPLDLRDYERTSLSFQKTVTYDIWRKNVTLGSAAGEPEQMRVGLMPAAYFEVLDIQPLMGRLFTEDENQEGRHYLAAISARLWRDRFAQDSAILGRKILINDEPYTIVAVLPDLIPEWVEGTRVEIWTPFARSIVWSDGARGGRGDGAIARLKPGVSLEEAQTDLATIAAQLAATYPIDRGIGVQVEKLADTRAGALRPMLFLLMAAVSLILLIACVNLANLLLARGSARKQELAVRAALGAGQTSLVIQLLAETLLLALAGGGLGLILAQFGVRSLTRVAATQVSQLSTAEIDWRVLTFTVIVSLLTSMLFGLPSAFTATRVNLVDALKQGGRSGTPGVSSQRMRSFLVATEVAMSLMLLVSASLVLQSILRLERQSLGIRADHLLTGHYFLPDARYPNPAAITRFSDDFGARVRSVPGVIEASVTTVFPPNNGWTQMLGIPGHPATRIQDIPSAEFGVTDSHFLRTMGIPLLRGRDFRESDNATSPPVALISQELQRRNFPTEDPIGRVIHIGPPAFLRIPPGRLTSDSSDVAIIGIIGNFRNGGLAKPPEPQIVVLYSQHPLVNYGFKDIVVRTASEPLALVPAIRRELHRMDRDMPFAQVRTIDELVRESTGGQRFTTVLLTLFAAAGIVLAVVGIYGVVAFMITQRRQELAVRMAIGASRSSVLFLVLGQSLRVAAVGAFAGLLGCWATQKLTMGLLFGISPVDPLTFAVGTLGLLVVAAIASLVPGARAMRIDPAQALRQE